MSRRQLAPDSLRAAWHARGRTDAELESALEDMVRAASAEWSDVLLDDVTFAAHAAERLSDEILADALATTCLPDLFLACACAAGQAHAIALLETGYLGPLDRSLVRKLGARSWSEDMQQRFRQKLLAAPEGERPKIAEYAGRGALRSWLRVTATRMVLSAATKTPEPAATDDEILLGFPSGDDDAETAYLRKHYGAAFKAALEEAVQSLEVAERNVLRYAFVDKLDIDRLAALYGVHRTSAGRRLAEARSTLTRRVRIALKHRLRVSDRELESIMGLIRSHLDVTFERLL